jgi:hypothetical protein
MPEIGAGLIDLIITLLFGWISFIRDVWPRISWNWGSIFTGILCSAIIFGLGHWFLAWLCRGIATARGKSFRCPWKWTACGLGAIALWFLIGMAVAGAAHQIGWIAQSEEPLYEEMPRNFAHSREVHYMGYMLRECLSGTDTVQSFRVHLPDKMEQMRRIGSSYHPDFQSVHLLMLVNSDAQVEGVVVFPRNTEARQKWGGEYDTHTNEEHLNPEVLSAFIESNASNLIAF